MISFVVPAHNEEKLLGATLEAIHAAAGGLGLEHEVVVAVDASTDATAEVARAGGARVVEVDHRQIAATRNAGAAATTGEWLVFVDADTLITPAVLAATIAAFESGAVGGGARIDFEGDAPWWVRALARAFEPVYFSLRLAAGCYVWCRRDAFLEVGGFDEQLFASEEIALSRELRRVGRRTGRRFLILRERVVTSGRKLRTHTVGEMLRPLGALLVRGRKAFHHREGLDLWYGPRREG